MMVRRATRGTLLAATLLCLCAADRVQAASKTVEMTTLILSITNWTLYDHAETVLRAYGAPYVKRFIAPEDKGTLNMTDVLTNADGSGKYGFIIGTPANVLNVYGGALDPTQMGQVFAYQETFGVRLVLEGPYVPSFANDVPFYNYYGLGVQLLDTGVPPPGQQGVVSASAPLTTSGVKAGAPLDFTGLYVTPVSITDSNRTTAVLTSTSPAQYAGGYTAVTTKYPSGREQFTTFFTCAAFSSDCLLVAHMYYAWGMHGILPGARDALFSIQVDDLFLATAEPFNTSVKYRMTSADSKNIATFAANVPSLPAGSLFKVEFVYNMGGVIEVSQPDYYYDLLDTQQPADVPIPFIKPQGTGEENMPHNLNLDWWNSTLWKKNDPLYNEIAFGASGLQFYLGHHTFNHEVLNNVVYWDALQQIRLNQAAAGVWNSTNSKFNRFSQTAMVTPAISGLRNIDALQALMDAGITAGAGDSSWPFLRNQANPWQAQVTSAADNGTVDGFYIIPRSPTFVYYDVSTEAVEAQLYNLFYCCNTTVNPTCSDGCNSPTKAFDQWSTWSDILAREQIRATRLLLALRPEGHMFHQANCRTSAGASNQSLLRQWVSAVVAAYVQRVTWPLQSLKLDDQLAYHKKRILRDACGLKYSLTYDDVTKSASALKITSTGGGCDAPVMIASLAVSGANPNPRVLGSEPRLYTVTLPAGGSKTLTLGSSIKWS